MATLAAGLSAGTRAESAGSVQFVGSSPQIRHLLQTVREAAPTDAPVLITGESGTGKEILAQTIHRLSHRGAGPYVAVNCGAIAGSLEESEMFGYVAGAFTGADRRKQGRFEAAHQGTVFLDEIGETSQSLQIKLLRVLQSGEYAPVGAAHNQLCDVRVVAATNQDLRSAVENGSFRADLFYRLDVVRLRVPALRERKEDIPLLVRHFVALYSQHYGMAQPAIEAGFYRAALDHDYPGNVRELSNYVHRAMILSGGRALSAGMIDKFLADRPESRKAGSDARSETPSQKKSAAAASTSSEKESFHDAKKRLIEAFEREYLMAVLAECGGIVYRAAERAGLSERGFHQKLKQYGIDGTSFRAGA